MFERLCYVMEKPELAKPNHYQTSAQRIAAREYIEGTVSNFTTAYPMIEVIQRCTDGGVPCGAINSISDIFEDPQFEARDNLLTVNEPGLVGVWPQLVVLLQIDPGIGLRRQRVVVGQRQRGER